MRHDPIESLLKHVGSCKRLDSAAAPQVARFAAQRVGVVGAAAAALLAAWVLPGVPQFDAGRTIGSVAPVPVLVEFGASPVDRDVRHFRPCSDENAFAVLLMREWSDECSCLRWDVLEAEPGRRLMELVAGQAVDIPIDLRNDPPIEQLVVLAVSRQREMLPSDEAGAEGLIACLNESAPPHLADERSSQFVSACLPQGVTLMPHSVFAASRSD